MSHEDQQVKIRPDEWERVLRGELLLTAAGGTFTTIEPAGTVAIAEDAEWVKQWSPRYPRHQIPEGRYHLIPISEEDPPF